MKTRKDRMITAVLFDVFETLVTERGAAPPRASSLGEALGLDGTAFRAAWKTQRPRVVRGYLSFGEALIEIGTQLGVAVDPDAVQRVCEGRVRAKAAVFQRIDPELVAVTQGLLEQGIRLAAVSNCFAEDVQAWPGCALAPQFASTVFSFEVGVAKPEPGIYLEAVRRLGVKPAEALFIGDGADDELLGAERAGLRTARAVWFLEFGADSPAFATVPRVANRQDVLELVAAGERSSRGACRELRTRPPATSTARVPYGCVRRSRGQLPRPAPRR